MVCFFEFYFFSSFMRIFSDEFFLIFHITFKYFFKLILTYQKILIINFKHNYLFIVWKTNNYI